MLTPTKIPDVLLRTCELISSWAAEKQTIQSIYIFGSMFTLSKAAPSDLDLAIEYIFSQESVAIGHIIADMAPWTRELEQITALKIDLDLAHPTGAPTVWSYLREGCGLVYERPILGLLRFTNQDET